MPKLTDASIAEATIARKKASRKLADGGGLSLLVQRDGEPSWRYRYRVAGKESSVSLGSYKPGAIGHVSIADARVAAIKCREQVKAGENPADVRRKAREADFVAARQTFGVVAGEYLELDDSRAARTVKKHRWLYDRLSPLHKRPLTGIDTPTIVRILKGIEAMGQREAAHRCAQWVNAVFRYAVQSGYCKENPARDLRGALRPKIVVSHAGITNAAGFGVLMNCVDAPGIFHANISNGLRLLARTAVRSIELRSATWADINFDKAEWLIPAEIMKMRRPHLVPLSRQAVAILREQQQVTGDGVLVFPGVRSGRPLNDASLGLALKTFVDSETHTPHGFRVSFSSLANEAGQDSALIELCLAHVKRDRVAGVYDRSQRLPERRALMQWWSDHIDECKAPRVATRTETAADVSLVA